VVGNRFRLTLVASAGGQVGAILMVMKGLCKDEMFGRQGHRNSAGAGLSMGGAVDLSNKQLGFIVCRI